MSGLHRQEAEGWGIPSLGITFAHTTGIAIVGGLLEPECLLTQLQKITTTQQSYKKKALKSALLDASSQ